MATGVLGVGGAGPVDGFSSSPDTAATGRYLEAWDAWEKTAAANLPTSTIAVDAPISEVEADCPGVLAHAPPPNGSMQETEQLLDLNEELNSTVLAAWTQPDRQALAKLVKSVTRVRWTNEALTELIHGEVVHYADSLAGSVPVLCADMRTWVDSGYTKVGRGTEALVRQRKTYRALLSRTPKGLMRRLFARYENASEKVFIRQLNNLTERLNRATGPLESAKQRIEQATGFPH